MEYTLQPGKQGNYQVTVTLVPDELTTYKAKALENFQKEMKVEGFRPGHAPLQMVEQKVAPEYLNVALYEEALHDATARMLEEHKDKKFIGTIYNLNIDDKKADAVTITFLIDVYPEVKETSDKWKKTKVSPVDATASKEEIEDTLQNLRKQYADYQPATEVGSDSVFKVSMGFLDKEGQEVHTGKLYLGKEDIDEFPILKEYFMGKKADEVVTITYDEKKLPHTMHLHKEGLKAATVEATI
ncbi:MAG: trigger factor [Candidatus Roizmanbacteria bacterium]|nr:trigger factor [Candidatus Roizmanbacteria bacterium]